MGCVEVLVHGEDVARHLGLSLDPPRDLCARVLARLFPDVDAGRGDAGRGDAGGGGAGAGAGGARCPASDRQTTPPSRPKWSVNAAMSARSFERLSDRL